MTAVLVVLALAFAWSMGAHYTGACMGMPHALGALTRRQALGIMAPLALAGAALASHAVERTVGHRLTAPDLGVPAEVLVVGLAFAITTVYTRLKVPTSTIQILVSCVVGVALGEHDAVRWPTIGELATLWVAAPVVAGLLGFGLTAGVDRAARARLARGGAPRPSSRATGRGVLDPLGVALVAVGAGASFVMGSNDVANATGSLVATHTLSPLAAGALGGAGLAVGVLTWGRPLLDRIAFEVVKLDRAMAASAQAVQAVVVVAAVSLGLFTSMNQALVGAMAGAAAARGRDTVHRAVLVGIVRAWFLGPAAGVALGFAISRATELLGGSGALG